MQIKTIREAVEDRNRREALEEIRQRREQENREARRRSRYGMTEEEAWALASATSPRIGVVIRKHRAVFYAVVGTDPFNTEIRESHDIGVIVDAIA